MCNIHDVEEMNGLQNHIEKEIRMAEQAEMSGDHSLAFSHLERAHDLGRSLAEGNTRIPWMMLKLAVKMRSSREICTQFIRLVGAATKTQFDGFPAGETVRLNISSFEPRPVPGELPSNSPTAKTAAQESPSRAAFRDRSEGVPSAAEIEKLAMSLSVTERHELASRLLRSIPPVEVNEVRPAAAMQQDREVDSHLRPGITLEELERRMAERFRV